MTALLPLMLGTAAAARLAPPLAPLYVRHGYSTDLNNLNGFKIISEKSELSASS
jgi:hypothetical protein